MSQENQNQKQKEQEQLHSDEVNAYTIVRPGIEVGLSLDDIARQNAEADEAIRKSDEEEARRRGISVEQLYK